MRRILTVVQLTACLALLSGAALLVGAGSGAGDAGEPGPPPGVEGPAAGTGGPLAGTVLLPLAFDDAADAGERHRAWEALAERVRGLPTVRAESIATPGAWKGLGRRDLVLADCGACVRGGLMVPFLGEDALHHAVSPDFFRSRGIPVLSGRGFTREDGPDARPVAVVNRTFALRSFERGDPLGRGVRVGGEGDRWYTVVGVVGDPAGPGLGRSGEPRPMLYLSSLQHPPDRAVLSLTLAGGGSVGGGAPPDDGGLPGGGIPPGLLDGLPLRATGPARTAEAWRARDAAPLLWAGRVSALAGVVTILVALLGVRAVSRIEVAARRRELGVRLALGATPRQVRLHVLGRSVRAALLATLLAVPASVAVAARVEELAGDVPLFQPGPYLLLAGLVVLAAGLGAWGPSAVAERTEPAVVLQEE